MKILKSIGVYLILGILVTGCVTAVGDRNYQRWQLASYSAAYGGSVAWLTDHPGDVGKFEVVAEELGLMSEQPVIILQDFLIVAKRLPIKELRNDGNIALIADTVVMIADSEGAMDREKVQLYLKPIVTGVSRGLSAGIGRVKR